MRILLRQPEHQVTSSAFRRRQSFAMRIGLVSQSFNNRTGIGRIVNALASEFIRLGHEVIGAAQEFEGTDGRMTRRRVMSFTSSKGLNKVLFRLNGPPFGESEIDIAHTFGVGRTAHIVSAQSCHRAGIELLHGKPYLGKSNFGFYDYVSLADEKALFTSISTRRIIAASRLVSSQIEEHYRVDSNMISIVPNGVDYKLFERVRSEGNRDGIRASLDLPEDKYVLLFVGNEFGRKGLQVLLGALSALEDQCAYLLVVGGDDQERYRRLAADLGIADQVSFVGSIPNPENLYAAADAFVLPTLYEPFGIAIIEAMAAGVPVITSKACGAIEGMQHRQHVLHLENPTSVDELAEAIRLLRRDDTLRKKMIASGLEKARELSWDRIAQRVIAVYNDVKRSL
jgi:UDP-glucose:(heptosyl)LPS alpha-1,3-glucosyltransferase